MVFFTCPKNIRFNYFFDYLSGVQDKVISNKKGLYPLFFQYFFYTKNECLFAFEHLAHCIALLPYLYALNYNYELRINR